MSEYFYLILICYWILCFSALVLAFSLRIFTSSKEKAVCCWLITLPIWYYFLIIYYINKG